MAGDRGVIKTKRITPQRDFQCLELFYYYNGADSDQLNIWIREFESGFHTTGAARLIGQITDSPENYWRLQHIQLRTTKVFQIEFEAVKGQGMSSGGFSLDDINLSETVCPHHIWHLRNFRQTLHSGITFQRGPKFYSVEGYRYRIYLTYVSERLGIYVSLVSGDYDYSLQWPCPNKQITVQLMEQTSSIQQRMSKQVTVTLYESQTTTSNGETVFHWDKPQLVGVQYFDSGELVFEGPLYGLSHFLSYTTILAGDFIQGEDSFLLISFEDVLNQPSPILPTPMTQSNNLIPSNLCGP
ncbi:hypothetical protein ACEWY4_003849 [Coilia grayii]|uniref:MAM domain-containing protein n=1 Tax=Coilia grayii TaxID=363190 RepID=A0ABD1KSD6_9TELE